MYELEQSQFLFSSINENKDSYIRLFTRIVLLIRNIVGTLEKE